MRLNQNLLKCVFLYQILKKFYLNEFYEEERTRNVLLSILRGDIELLRYNKVLVAMAEFMSKCYSYTDCILEQRMHRYMTYYNESRRIFSVFDRERLPALCFKTFNPVPKDLADVDILLRDSESLEIAEKLLAKLGYRRRKIGLEQHLWSIIKSGVTVDIELHTEVAAASFIYYPKDILFKRSEWCADIIIPSPLDSLLISVAHAVIKDFFVTLVDVLNFEVTVRQYKIDLNRLFDEAARYGLKLPLEVFFNMMHPLNSDMYKKRRASRLLSTRVDKYPLRPGIPAVLLAYLPLTVSKLKRESVKEVFNQVVHLPSGKGIDFFVKFLFGGEPPVKTFSE